MRSPFKLRKCLRNAYIVKCSEENFAQASDTTRNHWTHATLHIAKASCHRLYGWLIFIRANHMRPPCYDNWEKKLKMDRFIFEETPRVT